MIALAIDGHRRHCPLLSDQGVMIASHTAVGDPCTDANSPFRTAVGPTLPPTGSKKPLYLPLGGRWLKTTHDHG
jgi:hypothetical protein